MTVWVLPEDTWQHDDAADGDLLLRTAGDDLVVGRVQGQQAEWLGPVPPGALDVGPVDEPVEREDLSAVVGTLAEAAAGLGG